MLKYKERPEHLVPDGSGYQQEVYEGMSSDEIIEWAVGTFGSKLAFVTSFQVDGMVILDKAHRIDPNIRVLTVDTGRLPSETHDLIDRVRDHYSCEIEVHFPDSEEISSLVTQHGANGFYRSSSIRMLCCEARKVTPLNQALKPFEAWISGLRRSQSVNRADIPKVEIDQAHDGVTKLNPLAEWTHDEVWAYINENNVPYNDLYDKGYTSIGCAPCTRPIEPGEDARAGRWWWENGSLPKECGIHLSPAAVKAAIDENTNFTIQE